MPTTLDPETIATLRSYEADGIITLAELVETFLGDISVRAQSIAQAVSDSNAEQIEQGAHALKSAAANVGAFAMRDLCQELEDVGKSGNIDSAPNLFEALTAEIPRVEEALKALTSS